VASPRSPRGEPITVSRSRKTRPRPRLRPRRHRPPPVKKHVIDISSQEKMYLFHLRAKLHPILMTHEVTPDVESAVHSIMDASSSSTVCFPSRLYTTTTAEVFVTPKRPTGQHQLVKLTACQVLDGLFANHGVRQTGLSGTIALASLLSQDTHSSK